MLISAENSTPPMNQFVEFYPQKEIKIKREVVDICDNIGAERDPARFISTDNPKVLCTTLPPHWRSNKSLQHPFKVKAYVAVQDGAKVTLCAGNDDHPHAELKNNTALFQNNIARFNDLRFVGRSGRGKSFTVTIEFLSLEGIMVANYVKAIKVTVDGPREPRRIKTKHISSPSSSISSSSPDIDAVYPRHSSVPKSFPYESIPFINVSNETASSGRFEPYPPKNSQDSMRSTSCPSTFSITSSQSQMQYQNYDFQQYTPYAYSNRTSPYHSRQVIQQQSVTTRSSTIHYNQIYNEGYPPINQSTTLGDLFVTQPIYNPPPFYNHSNDQTTVQANYQQLEQSPYNSPQSVEDVNQTPGIPLDQIFDPQNLWRPLNS